jgi:hypothetical protein
VAASVPAAIYSIPPSSSLHYVTYVKVYRSTPEVVYVGYTPGYYGTVVSSTTTTVVYGTGFFYPPYIGSVWYGAPYTYGYGVATTWSSGTGWSITIGVGYTYGYPYYYPSWGPWGYYGSCCWGPAWGYGYGGYASANVYGRWGNAAYAGTGAAWANPYTGNYGGATRGTFQNTQRGTVGVAGRSANTNIYTGNTVAGRGAVGYNPNTGIVAGAAPDTRAICIPAKAQQDEAVLPTTQIPAPVSPRVRTIFTQERTVTSIGTTGRVAIGPRTPAVDGSLRPNPNSACNSNSRHVQWGSSERRISGGSMGGRMRGGGRR